MKLVCNLFAIVIAALLGVSPVLAQTAVGVGTGIASSRSLSAAASRSSSRSNAASTSSVRSANLNANQSSAGNTNTFNTTTTGQSPAVFAPGLAAAGIESCNGSVSLGGAAVGGGGALGFPWQDGPCNKRLMARTLWAFGQHEAALQTLCLDDELSGPMVVSGIVCRVGRYAPQASQQPSGAPVGEITDRHGRRYVEASCGSRGAVRTSQPGLCARRVAMY